jgi:hypothetical protein
VILAPAMFEDYSFCAPTFCVVCVQVMDFTDFFDNYLFQVTIIVVFLSD